MILNDLNHLGIEIQEKIKNYDNKELFLSDNFKIEFKKFLSLNSKDKIEYQKFTSIITTPKGLKVIFPNQWFYIASFFPNFLNSLWEYKRIVNDLKLSEETIKSLRKNSIGSELKSIIKTKISDDSDYEFFELFLTNYDWWYGSKTIDRGDFYVSSVLNLSNVVNVSHSYLADLAYFFSEDDKLAELLNKDYEVFLNRTENQKTLIEDKKLRVILFKTFKYIIDKFGEEIVLQNYELKDAKIEDRFYNGLALPNYFGFETVVGLFDKTQTTEELKSSGTPRFIDEKIHILGNENSYFTSQWNGVENGRGLSLENFNRLLFDITNNKIEIVKKENIYRLVEKSFNNVMSNLSKPENIIFYGSPGTGKSYKVDNMIKELDTKYYERVTFHPEYDNSCFIGGYRPNSYKEKFEDKDGEEYFEHEVHYEFVPQAFTNIYKRAWLDEKNQYYLVIEEINRGNCAEIFGEIFQLLDRTSNYTVSPSKELKEYLENEAFNNVNHEGVVNGLKLPPNLTILATMNTSDQSLFPMDSAFKRRWDWEYIPICYEENDDNGKINKSYYFEIEIEDDKKYSWIKFIEIVNLNHIKNNASLGMDKCIGNYFIKPDNNNTISLKPFINKVIFYLWNDVFKDEDNKVFEDNTSYEDFFPIATNGKKKIIELFDRIELKPIKISENLEINSQLEQIAKHSEETQE
jgi:hypothetical protein